MKLKTGLICSWIVIAGLAGIVVFTAESAGGTLVSGTIYNDTTWDLDGSPYITMDNMTVAENVTLAIEAGVVVMFGDFFRFYINGSLLCQGTDGSRVTFTSDDPWPDPGDWDRIQVNPTGRVMMEYTNITYGMCALDVKSSNNRIENCNIFSQWDYGILIEDSANNIIAGNNIFAINGTGISAISFSNSEITDNSVHGNEEGVVLDSSSNNTVSNNTFTDNRNPASWGTGLRLRASSCNNSISHNNLSFNYAGLIVGHYSNNNTFAENEIRGAALGISVTASSNDNTVTGNVIERTADGIQSWGSINNIITENTVTAGDGVSLYLASGHHVTDNYFWDCGTAIQFESTFNCTITDNVFDYNSKAIRVESSSNNRIYHNDFIDTVSDSGYDDGSENFWDNGYPSGGNYWSDYCSQIPDLFSGEITPQTTGTPDGICDSRYEIDTDSIDYYPLKEPANYRPRLSIVPLILDPYPYDGTFILENLTWIGADFNLSIELNTERIIFEIDGEDVTEDATLSDGGITIFTQKPLDNGPHTIYLEVKDIEGNMDSATWSFTVDSQTPHKDPRPSEESPVSFLWFFLVLTIVIIIAAAFILQNKKRA